MVDLVMIAIFSWRLHGMAIENGLSPWKWVSRFLSGYFLFGLLLSLGLVWYYGKEAFQDLTKITKLLLPFTPIFLLFLVGWFIFLRGKIMKTVALEEQKDKIDPPSTPTEPTEEKKDLSYFR